MPDRYFLHDLLALKSINTGGSAATAVKRG
jgi:hypothetical protein